MGVYAHSRSSNKETSSLVEQRGGGLILTPPMRYCKRPNTSPSYHLPCFAALSLTLSSYPHVFPSHIRESADAEPAIPQSHARCYDPTSAPFLSCAGIAAGALGVVICAMHLGEVSVWR